MHECVYLLSVGYTDITINCTPRLKFRFLESLEASWGIGSWEAWRGIRAECGRTVGVCDLLFIHCYMRPEGPWQRPAAVWRQRRLLNARFLSQIEMIDPTRAPLSPSPP